MNFLKTAVASAALVVAGASAQAASVNITLTQYDSAADAVAAWAAFVGTGEVAYEDFDDFTSYDEDSTPGAYATTQGGLSTNVGTFRRIGPTGTGGTSVDPEKHAIVRSGPDVGARADVDKTPGEGNWLDSNDNGGIKLSMPDGQFSSAFWKIAMVLTDVDDIASAAFSLTAKGAQVTPNTTIVNDTVFPNGTILLATFSFSEAVSDVTIKAQIDPGDGFGVDGVVAAVPLPAAGWMLLAGLGGLAATRRRKS